MSIRVLEYIEDMVILFAETVPVAGAYSVIFDSLGL
jgi:hypothetical protein